MAHLSTALNIISSCQISSHLIKIIATFIAIISSVILTGTIAGLHLREAALASHGSDFWVRSNVNHCICANRSQTFPTVITIFIALTPLRCLSAAQIVQPSIRKQTQLCVRIWTFDWCVCQNEWQNEWKFFTKANEKCKFDFCLN